jgi:hypothetical protein
MMSSKRATPKSNPKRSTKRRTKTGDSTPDGRGPTGSRMWSVQDRPQVYESWRQRGGGNLACKQGNEDAFCMGTPVIMWIERHEGSVSAWCVDHASGAYPPAGLVSGVMAFVLLAGWTAEIARQAQDWTAALAVAQVHTRLAADAERAVA